jgi:hypothetical protein
MPIRSSSSFALAGLLAAGSSSTLVAQQIRTDDMQPRPAVVAPPPAPVAPPAAQRARALAESLIAVLDRGDVERASELAADIAAATQSVVQERDERLAAARVADEIAELQLLATEAAAGRFTADFEARVNALVVRAEGLGRLVPAYYVDAVKHLRWQARNQMPLRTELAALDAIRAAIGADPSRTAQEKVAARFAVTARMLRPLTRLVEWPEVRGLTAELQAQLPAAGLAPADAAAAGRALAEIATVAARSTPAAAGAYEALAALTRN